MTTDRNLQGKVAVLTGASRNIGKAVAVEFVKRGAKVVIGDILDAEGEATVKELNASANEKVAAFIHTDVTKYKDNKALFALAETEFGGVDIAFLNAGVGTNANNMFLPMDDAVEERMMDINTTAVIKGTKVAMLHMAKRNGDVIINTASTSGIWGFGPVACYNTSKFGVVGWTRSCESFKDVCGVRVNAIWPTWVAVNLRQKENIGNPFTEIFAHMPITTTETVVKAVMMLIEEDEFRNTQTLMVLANGIIREQPPTPLASEMTTEEGRQLAAKKAPDVIAYYRKQLEEARTREGI